MADNAATRLLDQYLTPTKTWRIALTDRSAALDAAEVTDDPADVRRRAHARWYEEIVSGWILRPAKALASSSNRHEGMAAIALAIQFLEVHGAAVEGTETKSCEELVKEGYKEVSESGWPDPDDIYHHLRCGLFHAARIRGPFLLVPRSGQYRAFWRDSGVTWQVDPANLVEKLRERLSKYVRKVQETKATKAGVKKLQTQFDAWFEAMYGKRLQEAEEALQAEVAQGTIRATTGQGESETKMHRTSSLDEYKS